MDKDIIDPIAADRILKQKEINFKFSELTNYIISKINEEWMSKRIIDDNFVNQFYDFRYTLENINNIENDRKLIISFNRNQNGKTIYGSRHKNILNQLKIYFYD